MKPVSDSKKHISFADEYEEREGLSKLPYKLLLQQSEIRNGQLLAEIDELIDKIDALQATIVDQQQKINDLKTGNAKRALKDAIIEIKSEWFYLLQKKRIAKLLVKIKKLQETNGVLISRIRALERRSQ